MWAGPATPAADFIIEYAVDKARRRHTSNLGAAAFYAARFYMTHHRLVLTTTSSPGEARKLANALVEKRLAACVNILPKIASIYRWKDKVEESQEFLLLIKTTDSSVEKVREAIQELHSYELPECIVLPIEGGSEAYLKWIDDSVS